MKPPFPPGPPPELVAYELEPGKVVFVLPLPKTPHLEALSPGEREVLTLVLDGQSTASIASARGTSSRTVSNQIASIFKKLQVRSRAELAAKLLGSADRETPRGG